MPRFEYRGVTTQGTQQSGQVEAPDEQAAVQGLAAQGVTPFEITPIKEAVKVEDLLARRRRVPTGELTVFTRQLATLVDSGVSVLNALVILEEQILNVRLRETLQRVIDEVEGGLSLSEAMAREPAAFSQLYIAMVRAGESSGSLHQTLSELASQLEREEKLRKQIKSAMRYPIVVAGVAGLVAVMLLTFVVPQFEALFATLGGDLPGPTQVVLQISQALVPPDGKLLPVMPLLFVAATVVAILAGVGLYRLLELRPSTAAMTTGGLVGLLWAILYTLQFEPSWLLLNSILLKIPGFADYAILAYGFDFPSAFIEVPTMVAVVGRLALLVGFVLLARNGISMLKATPQGRRAWDRFKLNAPMKIGPVVQKVVAARFTRTLSTLTSSGVPILTAFEIVKGTANNVLVEEAAESARQQVARGSTIAEPLAEANVLPSLVTHMINVGEKTGALDQMLLKTAQYYEDEVEISMKNLTSIIEPIMIVLVGVIIGGLVVTLYLPLFRIFDLLSASSGALVVPALLPAHARAWSRARICRLRNHLRRS